MRSVECPMDIFAEDDLYNDIFQSLNVLTKFEEGLATLTQSSGRQEANPSMPTSQVEMDTEEQEDIMFNAQRFVEYKRQSTQGSDMIH